MPTTVVCPDCRRPQVPREEAGRLFCPDCDAILPSGLFAPGSANESADARASSSALDHPAAGQPRPSGSITLLRSGLRSDEKNQPGGWMEGLFSRKAKAPAEKALAPAGRVDREPAEEPMASRPSARSASRDHPLPEEPASPAARPSGRTDILRRAAMEASGTRPGESPARVPISGILAGLAVLTIATLALLRGMGIWADVLFLATTFLLAVSLLGVMHRSDTRKAFWQGFALFGWGYLAMAIIPWGTHPAGLELPTSPLLGRLHARAEAWSDATREPAPAKAAEPSGPASPPEAPAPAPQMASMFTPGDRNQFLLVGHCLFALMAAFVGSGIALWFRRSHLDPA